MIQAALAALAAGTGLMGKLAKDHEDAARENRAKEAFKQQQIQAILQARTADGGGDTSRSTLAGNEQQFLRELAAQRRDTSGDWVPFVKGLGGVAQAVAGDLAKSNQPQPSKAILPAQSPVAAPAAQTFEYPSYSTPVIDEDERNKFLASLARQNGWQV